MTDRSIRRVVPLLMALQMLAITPDADARRPTLLQRLRELIGLNPNQAVGGSRGISGKSICLITPRMETTAEVISPRATHSTSSRRTGWGSSPEALPTAVVSVPTPTLLAAGELNEVRLEQAGRILWQQRATSTSPIRGQISWPLEPLTPGQEVLLRLRPSGAAGVDFADIRLKAGSASQQREALALLNNPANRLEAIITAASKGSYVLASELVFAAIPNPPKMLESLRQELLSGGCSSSGR